MLRPVRFVGPLADRLGSEPLCFEYADWNDVYNGLSVIVPDFRSVLNEYDELCIMKRRGDQWASIPHQELEMRFGKKTEEIVISAGTSGSAAAAAAYVVTALGLTGTAAAIATVITYVAVTIAISAATSAVMKSLADTPDAGQERAMRESNLFSIPQNVTLQGGGRPLQYGRRRVGGTVISSETTTDRMGMLMPDVYQVVSGETFTRNVTSNDIMRDRITIDSWKIGSTTYAMGQTFTKTETSPQVLDSWGEIVNPGTQDGYSVRLEANGTLTITSQGSVAVTLDMSYTATDEAIGSDLTTTITAKVAPRIGSISTGSDGPGDAGVTGEAPGGDTGGPGDGDGGGVSI